jgi:hypothetical protein
MGSTEGLKMTDNLPKLYEMTLEETLEYLNSTKPQPKSVSPPEKKKEDELPQYFYDICTNLFIC